MQAADRPGALDRFHQIRRDEAVGFCAHGQREGRQLNAERFAEHAQVLGQVGLEAVRVVAEVAAGVREGADLDEAVQNEPQSLQAWTTRGLAYERLGDKDKAAGSYARAMAINGQYAPAKQGFARVGGKPGQTYNTFD